MPVGRRVGRGVSASGVGVDVGVEVGGSVGVTVSGELTIGGRDGLEVVTRSVLLPQAASTAPTTSAGIASLTMGVGRTLGGRLDAGLIPSMAGRLVPTSLQIDEDEHLTASRNPEGFSTPRGANLKPGYNSRAADEMRILATGDSTVVCDMGK